MATITAAGTSPTQVNAAIASANPGDTVIVPAGSGSWNTIGAVNLNKAITLAGSGGNSLTNPSFSPTTTIGTPLNLSNQSDGGLSVNPPTTGPGCRVTGFAFVGNWCVGVNGAPASVPTRLDACTMNGTSASGGVTMLSLSGNLTFLCDHTSITGVAGGEFVHNFGTNHTGSGSAGDGWNTNVTPGSPLMAYFESCTFTCSQITQACPSALQSYYGALTVVRNCNFLYCGIDQHGGNQVGSRWWEFYNNTFDTNGGNVANPFPIYVRAGSGVIWGNTVIVRSGNFNAVTPTLWCDNGSGGNNNSYPPPWGPCRGWSSSASDSPTSAQNLSPVYIWGNSSNMQPDQNSGTYTLNSDLLINRDFYVSASQPAANTMLIWQKSTDSAGTTYNYSPFTFPYPLTAGGFPSPSGSAPTPLIPTVVQHVSFACNNNVSYGAGTPVAGNPFHFPFPNVVLAGNALILHISNPTSSVSISDNRSNTWTLLKTVTNGTMMSSIYGAFNVAAGQTTITATFGGNLFCVSAAITEWNNCAGAADASSATTTTATTTIAAPSLTPTVTGDLILQYGFDTSLNNPGNTSLTGAVITNMTAGSGFKLLSTDLMLGTFVQYQVYNSTSPIAPSLVVTGGTDNFNTVAVALTASLTAQGSPAPSTGIRVQSLHHINYYRNGAIQIPSSGNLLYVASAAGTGNGGHIASCTAPGNTFTPLPTSTGDGNGPPIGYYAANAVTSNTLKITCTGMNSLANQSSVFVYDIARASTAPFDRSNVNGAGGDGSVPGRDQTFPAGSFSFGSVTPSTPNGLVICTMATYLGVITSSPQGLLTCTYGNQVDADLMDNADGVALVYNTTASTVNFSWVLGGDTPAGGSGEFPQTVAFKSGAAPSDIEVSVEGAVATTANSSPRRILRPFHASVRF